MVETKDATPFSKEKEKHEVIGCENAVFEHDSPSPSIPSPSIERKQDRPPPKKSTIIKNVLAISFGFLLNFTAFSALANIQSSLNSDSGLGTASLSVIYGALIVSCMFVPTALIARLGCKWTMVVSMLMYSAYIAANFYATWYTMIPGAILIGLGAAPLWSAKCTYLTEIGQQYAELVGETAEVIIVRFFGIFFMLFQTSQIWGNLISSLVFSTKSTDISFSRDFSICGANYCNEDLSGNVTTNATSAEQDVRNNAPDMHQIIMLCGIYLACSILGAILIAVAVNPLQRLSQPSKNLTGFQLLIATFRHMKHPYQLLIIPLTIFSGMEQAYIGGDFTKAFINCTLGIHNVGFVMICLGVVDAICSLAFGPLVKFLGRPPLYIFGAIINISLVITMLHWHPDPEAPVVLYIIAALWGMADAIWQTQINAFYGVIFSQNTEAAFANYRLWESLGFIIGYAWHTSLCINMKLYLLTIVLCLGMVGYGTVEILMKFFKKS